jgi:hypothetical protein
MKGCMKLSRGLLVVAGLLIGLAGCSSDSSGSEDSEVACTTHDATVSAIVLTVYDQRTRALLDGASAEFVVGPLLFDPAYPELVLPGETFSAPLEGTPTIDGPRARAGTYSITVTRPGYSTWSREGVVVVYEDCVLQTARIDVELVPTHDSSKPPEIPCPPPQRFGAIVILVRDSETGEGVTGVNATAARADGYTQTETASSDILIQLALDAEGRMEGTYTVTLRRAGYQDWIEADVVVTKGTCGTVPAMLDVRMVPL